MFYDFITKMQEFFTFFSTKHIGVFQLLTFEIKKNPLTIDVICFEQQGLELITYQVTYWKVSIFKRTQPADTSLIFGEF